MNRSITDWRRACIESQMRAYERRQTPRTVRPTWRRIVIACIVAAVIAAAIGWAVRP